MADVLLERFNQAYRNLDLFPLIEPQDIEDFRVDYGNDTIARLKRLVLASEANGKMIFAGHRGCGKSTLLAKFRRVMMDQNLFVVFFSIADFVEMSDVNHVNILYTIALKLLSEATRSNVPLSEGSKTALLDWFSTTRTQTYTDELKQELAIGGDFLKFVTAKLKNEGTFREEIKRTFERRISELARKTDEIVAAIQTAYNKDVLVIIDDLDKLDLPLVEAIYRDNINSLLLPQFRIIFTIPISVVRDPELNGVLQSAGISRIEPLAVAKLFPQELARKADAEPIEATMAVLLNVLQKRVDADLIEPETARKIVLKSGGVMRELVRLARECCIECLLVMENLPDQPIKINDEILTRALRTLRNDFARRLGETFYQLLLTVYREFTPPDGASENFLELLHGLYVLEYENDDLWYDLHPIVRDLLERKKLI